MQDLDDHDLLRHYTEQNSEEAFAALVARHVNKVYSVALRHTRNPHQAEEITQVVFVILARKSAHLGKRVILEGWLYLTARMTAVTLVRSEIRRARREQEALMQSLQNESEPEIWTQIAPMLDTALAQLNGTDRHAIVLRYIYSKSMKEIGAALGVNEKAAKMRVHRALDKLHAIFGKLGIKSSSAIIAEAISANSVQAAPASLATSVTALAIGKGAAANSSTLTLIKGALKIMAWSKAKTTIMGGTAVLLVVCTTAIVVTQTGQPDSSSLARKLPGIVSQRDEAVTADRTTPKGTMLVMANAMKTGDAQSYVDSFVFATSEELKLRPTLESLVAATARFTDAVSNKFGADAARTMPNLPFQIPVDRIQSLKQTLQGDSATVSIGKKGGRPIQFTRINGEWKMAADGFVHRSPAVMNDLYNRVIQALDETTPEIPQNKFPTPMDAVNRVKERAR